ncbi:MAG: type II secretion system protein GspC [Rhodanobacteraceae bacterium]|jgi:general secretion pathway protein C|nr:type II secretion system protein GspC [Rhodanobacteraceae bacterium]
MAGRWAGIDHGRRVETAAALAGLLLAALALWLLVRLVLSLWPRDDAAFEVPAATAAFAEAAAPTPSVAGWHLFGQSPRQGAVGGSAPSTTLALILRGTVAERDPAAGLALIADAGNGERAFRVGEEVAPGARLVGVYPDRIVLRHDGVEETLTLPRERNLAPAEIVRPTPARVSSATSPVAPAAPATAQAPTDWQQTVARLRQNPAELARRVQVVPVLDGGKLAGVRLSAGADAALLNQLGLRPGDLVTAVNGAPVDSLARGQEIMASLAGARAVRVTVQRDGQPVDLSVGLP